MTANSAPAVLKADHHWQRHVTMKGRGLKTLATGTVATLLLVAAMQWPQANSDVAPGPALSSSSEPQISLPFSYFPSEYRNNAQSGPAEEHISAY
jgi:hypothetical protein